MIKEYLKCETCSRTESPPYDVGDECWCGGKFIFIDEVEYNGSQGQKAEKEDTKTQGGRLTKDA